MSLDQSRTGDPQLSETHFATHCGGQRANDSVITHPSKRIGTSWPVSHIGHNNKAGTILYWAAYPWNCRTVWLRYEVRGLQFSSVFSLDSDASQDNNDSFNLLRSI